MRKSTRLSLLVGILIIATFLRFYHFTTTPPGLYPDEAIDGNNAAEVARTGHFQTFYTEDNGREGLYINIIAVMLSYFHAPHEPWVIRFPAAVAGVLTVLGLYLLIAELFGEDYGLLSSFLLAVSFWHINFSRIGFRAILAPLLLTWAVFLLIKVFKEKSRGWAMAGAIAAGVIYGAGFYTYIAYRITPLLFLLFIPFFKKYPGFTQRAMVFIAAIVITAAPIGIYFLGHPGDFFGRTSQIAVTNSSNPIGHFMVNLGKTLLMFNVRGDGNWRHNIADAPELFWPVGILFLLGIIIAGGKIYRYFREWLARREIPGEKYFGLLFIFSWFICAILPAAASDEGLPHALRSILMIPPVMAFAAIAGVALYRVINAQGGKIVARIMAAVFVSGVAIAGYMSYFVIWAQNPNVSGAFNADYVTIGRALNALPPSIPKFVVVEAGGVMTRGIPMPAETTIFITDTFLPDEQAAKNIRYLLPEETDNIPPGTPQSQIFYLR